jgi:hypothetical protein
VGVDLSMLESLDTWNPFDLLIERDSSRTARPDFAFLADPRAVPVVGVVLAHRQKEYAQRSLHAEADAHIEHLIRTRDCAPLRIDTRLDENASSLRSAAAVEALVARTDVVLTTRLHGLVLALKHGIPVVAIDPVAGGAKLARQGASVGWPHVFTADRVTRAVLEQALDDCLTAEARADAARCRERAVQALSDVRARLLSEFRPLSPKE